MCSYEMRTVACVCVRHSNHIAGKSIKPISIVRPAQVNWWVHWKIWQKIHLNSFCGTHTCRHMQQSLYISSAFGMPSFRGQAYVRCHNWLGSVFEWKPRKCVLFRARQNAKNQITCSFERNAAPLTTSKRKNNIVQRRVVQIDMNIEILY